MDDFTLSAGGLLTVGAGTDVQLVELRGLGRPENRGGREPRGDRHGDVAGDDVLNRRLLYATLRIKKPGDPAAAWALRDSIVAVWPPSRVDTYLDVALPGISSAGRRFFGRCGPIDDNLVNLKYGAIDLQATFEALDPLGYGPEESSGAESGTFSIDNDGTAPTDRITLEIVGNGGLPVLKNNTDSAKSIRFSEAVSGTYTVDVRARTVVDGSGDDAYADLSPTNRWFDLLPGSNSLTLTGATSVDVTHRPAWY